MLLKQLFGSWDDCDKHREVVAFTCGLMKDPRHLVDHVYQLYIQWQLSDLRLDIGFSDGDQNLQDLSLFDSLYKESKIPLTDHPQRNKYINILFHREDDEEGRLRQTKISVPSRLYMLSIEEDITYDIEAYRQRKESEEIPECAMIIGFDPPLAKSLFATVYKISQHQPITDFMMEHSECDDLTENIQAPIMSKDARSLNNRSISLPEPFWRSIICQLSNCLNLELLQIEFLDLPAIEEELDMLFETLVSHHKQRVLLTLLHDWFEQREAGVAQHSEEAPEPFDLRWGRVTLLGTNREPHYQTALTLSLGVELSEEFKKKWKQCCKKIPSISFNHYGSGHNDSSEDGFSGSDADSD